MGSVLVAELSGERCLKVEHDAVLAPAGEVMQPDPQVLQQRFVALELAGFLALDQVVSHQIAPATAHAGSARNPLDDLQVAHPARRLLQIGLERVGGVVMLRVALFLLELLRLQERRRIRHAAQRRLHVAEQAPAPGEEAGFEQGRVDGDVARRGLDAIADGTHAVADLEPDVPEAVDQPFQALLLGGARLVGQKNQQVDVRARIKLAAPIAAGRHQRGIG